MADARRRHDWDQTAELLALLANAHRDPKKRRRPYSSADFHPLPRAGARSRPQGIPLTTGMIDMLGNALGIDPDPDLDTTSAPGS
jgi:hypothetical protein